MPVIGMSVPSVTEPFTSPAALAWVVTVSVALVPTWLPCSCFGSVSATTMNGPVGTPTVWSSTSPAPFA